METGMSCGAPELEAGALMSHTKGHCFFVRQPNTAEEVNTAILSLWSSCCVLFDTAAMTRNPSSFGRNRGERHLRIFRDWKTSQEQAHVSHLTLNLYTPKRRKVAYLRHERSWNIRWIPHKTPQCGQPRVRFPLRLARSGVVSPLNGATIRCQLLAP